MFKLFTVFTHHRPLLSLSMISQLSIKIKKPNNTNCWGSAPPEHFKGLALKAGNAISWFIPAPSGTDRQTGSCCSFSWLWCVTHEQECVCADNGPVTGCVLETEIPAWGWTQVEKLLETKMHKARLPAKLPRCSWIHLTVDMTTSTKKMLCRRSELQEGRHIH